MDNLDSVISDYLKKQTNYAVLITGKWGSGKTYYYKHTITETIKDTSVIGGSIKYKPIYISLFGVTSLEDIHIQIFLSLYPFLKNKSVKLSIGLGKAIARGMFALQNLGNIDDYFSDVKTNPENWINFDQLVICFDDLERRSNNLRIEELIGYINTLVENNDTKIILIANEDKIDEPQYTELKEKVIGITVEFLPEFKKQLQIIIDKYYKTYETYASFLKNNQNFLLKFSEAFDNNLRLLIFALENFHIIYSSIKKDILDIPAKKNSIISQKLEDIMRFTISISIEYRKNNISYKDRHDIDLIGKSHLDEINFSRELLEAKANNTKEEKKSYSDIFLDKYYRPSSGYYFFESIYSYITGAAQFSLETLLSEIDEIFHVKKDKVLPQYELLNKLDYRNYYRLSNKEYLKSTRQVLGYARRGEFKVIEYFSIYGYLMRFKNRLNLNEEKIKSTILKGIRKSKSNSSYIHTLDMALDIPSDLSYRKEYIEIRNAIIKVNNEIHKEEEIKKCHEIVSKIENDWDSVIPQLNDQLEEWRYNPFLQYASAHKIYLIINNSPNQKIHEFAQFFNLRYNHVIREGLKPELPFLATLKNKLLPKSMERQKKNLKNYLLDQIYNQIEKAIGGFNSIE